MGAAILAAPLLSSGLVSSRRADWEYAWIRAKAFWEGVQRTYLLSPKESGNVPMSKRVHGEENSAQPGRTQRENRADGAFRQNPTLRRKQAGRPGTAQLLRKVG